MFNKNTNRYITRAINDNIHPEIQKILWDLIDEQRREHSELDYLQVFELREKHRTQHIIHKQEIPNRQLIWIFPLKHTEPINGTVWCMDHEEYQMMLFPSDY